MKKYNLFVGVFLCLFNLNADEILESEKIIKLHTDDNELTSVYIFDGTPSEFSLKKVIENKPKKSLIKKIRLVDDNDIYAVKIFNKNEEYLYTLGIGNPFYAHATHIGFEDSDVMGGPVNSNIIEISIPTNIKPSYFVISKRNNVGLFDDIQKISLP